MSLERPVSDIQLRREEYRRGRTRRSTLIAFVSTLAFAALCAVTLLNSPGWTRVRDQFFDLEVPANPSRGSCPGSG